MWEEAASLLPDFKMTEVARALRLNRTALKEKVEQIQGHRRDEPAPTFLKTDWEFVEENGGKACRIALKRTDGTEMSLEVDGDQWEWVRALALDFCGGR